jgi:hypothetical protein
VFFAVDHVVLATTQEQKQQLAARLTRSGFVRVPGRLRFDDIGAHSESLAFRGGGFVELVYEVEAGRAPAEWFTAEVPRVIGLGFASDDFEADTRAWRRERGAWTMDETQTLDDGARLRIHAAGPHRHLSDFYVFAMDRRDGRLEHPALGGTAELLALTFAGARYAWWRDRLRDWLALDDLRLGTVELRFAPASDPNVRVTPRFGVPAEPDSLALAAGSIELSASPAQPSSG